MKYCHEELIVNSLGCTSEDNLISCYRLFLGYFCNLIESDLAYLIIFFISSGPLTLANSSILVSQKVLIQ